VAFNTDGGVEVTGSHLDKEWNGFNRCWFGILKVLSGKAMGMFYALLLSEVLVCFIYMQNASSIKETVQRLHTNFQQTLYKTAPYLECG